MENLIIKINKNHEKPNGCSTAKSSSKYIIEADNRIYNVNSGKEIFYTVHNITKDSKRKAKLEIEDKLFLPFIEKNIQDYNETLDYRFAIGQLLRMSRHIFDINAKRPNPWSYIPAGGSLVKYIGEKKIQYLEDEKEKNGLKSGDSRDINPNYSGFYFLSLPAPKK